MHGSAQPEDPFPPVNTENTIAETNPSSPLGAVRSVGDPATSGPPNGGAIFNETELDSALQLLVERAQYITGATGTALALPQGDEMVCRASAGTSAPSIGARLQVRSGLTGESIARRQLLRCDNAETDPRVNLETCRALGIASIVVLPLLQSNGEVLGLFELFSDHPYAFEERDLIALERMADLTLTALKLARRQETARPVRASKAQTERSLGPPAASAAPPLTPTIPFTDSATPAIVPVPSAIPASAPVPDIQVDGRLEGKLEVEPELASVPAAMLRVQKCAACGFPISEGRTLCLDCEKKNGDKRKHEQELESQKTRPLESDPGALSRLAAEAPSSTQRTDEFIPAFLANPALAQESWLANHVNLLAIIVLILGILVAVVVFR